MQSGGKSWGPERGSIPNRIGVPRRRNQKVGLKKNGSVLQGNKEKMLSKTLYLNKMLKYQRSLKRDRPDRYNGKPTDTGGEGV